MLRKSKRNKMIDRFLNKTLTEGQFEETISANNLLNYCSILSNYQSNTVIVFSADRNIISINNDAVEKFLGYEPKNVLDFYQMFSRDTYNALESSFAQTLEGNIEKHIIDVEYKGNKLDLLLTFIPIKFEAEKLEGVYLTIENTSKESKELKDFQKEYEEKLKHLAYYDELTQLPNQRSLYERLDQDCKNDVPFALMYLDIDRFNMINDSLGYEVGDEVLKIISERLISILPKNAFLARLSSNDFIITIRLSSHDNEVSLLAERIIQMVELPILIQDYEIFISTSIGISFYPEEGEEKLSLIENAHTALFLAKREGKGNYQFFSFSKDISSYKKYVLDRDMRKAIINEEFELYFQPKVEPRRGQIYGAEVLIRWNHKEWGAVSPSEFIPIAEENHMINKITDWVIKKVIHLLKLWKEKGYILRTISVNIPPMRFMHTGLIELIKAEIEKNNIPAKYLELEVTESILLRSEQIVLSTIEGLKDLGVKIAIDDFGTGYSSFDLLRKFQPDTLKIDRVFVQNIHHENQIERGIISSILYLAKTLGLKVVAEGVEEVEQLAFLQQQECDFVQGYLFSKPVTQSEYERFMQKGYMSPQLQKKKDKGIEKREFFRFHFPHLVLGNMTIIEVNQRRVQVGATPILLENISLGGIKFLSNLKLPINSNMKFKFDFQLINQTFEIEGTLKWITDEFGNIFSYGVSFHVDRVLEDTLAPIINRMSALNKINKRIPDTEFIFDEAHLYLMKSKID
nr:EAL domain-containing protein [Lysinibacillus timonensis]